MLRRDPFPVGIIIVYPYGIKMSVVGLRNWELNNGRKLHPKFLLTTSAWIPQSVSDGHYKLSSGDAAHIHAQSHTSELPNTHWKWSSVGTSPPTASVYESWRLTLFWSQVPSQKRYPIISTLLLCLITKPDFRQKFKLPLPTESPSNSLAHSNFQLCQALSALQTSPIFLMSSPASRFNQTLLWFLETSHVDLWRNCQRTTSPSIIRCLGITSANTEVGSGQSWNKCNCEATITETDWILHRIWSSTVSLTIYTYIQM